MRFSVKANWDKNSPLTARTCANERGTNSGNNKTMICPKCGFQQEEGPECIHCGVIFARLRRAEPSAVTPVETGQPQASLFVRSYRIFRWVCLVGLIIALFGLILILRTSPPPQIPISSYATERAESKVREFKSTISQGSPGQLQMNESELNGWLAANLAINRAQRSEASSPQALDSAAADPESLSDADIEEAQSSLRDVKVQLEEDSLKLYAIFDMRGKNLSLELDGRPLVEDGYLKMDLTGGKLGSLPIPSLALQKLANRIFDSPQNKEKFKLPPGIQDMRIEDGQLRVISE
jgi:hypothetical protein